MKASFLILAATLFSTTAALAQTQNPNPPSTATQPNTSNPAAVPSGDAPVQANPKGNVSAGEVFTKGSPDGQRMRDKNMMKRKKMSSDRMSKKTDSSM